MISESDYRSKLKHFEILNDFYSSLIGINDSKKVAQLAVKALMKYSNSPSVGIFKYIKEKEELHLIASKGFGSSVVTVSNIFKVNDSFSGSVVKSKKIGVLKNLEQHRGVNESAKEALTKSAFKCVISVPLLYNNEAYGTANLIFRDFAAVRDVDYETLSAIGKSIAMAMINSEYVNGFKYEIQKRTLAEKQLKQSKTKYKELVENINDLIVKFDTKGRLLYVSPNYCRLFNVTQSNVIGKKFLPQIHPEDLPKINRQLKSALMHPYISWHEERMLTMRGWRWIQWSNRAIDSSSGSVKEIIAIGRDITEKKEAELALIKSESNFKAIIDAIPDVLFRINKDGVYLDYYANDNNPLKIPKHLVVNQNAVNRLPAEVYNEGKKKFFRVINSGVAETIEYSIASNGEEKHFEGRIVKSGTDEALVIVRDITELKNYQEEIGKLALIARETDNGIIITDKNHKIEWVNNAFSKITGYLFEEIAYKRPGDFLLGDESDKKVAKLFEDSINNKSGVKTEIVNYHKTGKKLWLELNAQPILDNKGNIEHVIYIQHVITERKEYELMLKEKQERLSELTKHLIAMRESERADIARGVHDELGQIVAAVKMNLGFLIGNLSDASNEMSSGVLLEELKSMSKMIDKSVISIRRLIKNLRPETLDKLGLVAAIKQLLEDFKNLTKINYRFAKNFEELTIDEEKSITAYRTVQESLTNIIKHSEATKVGVELKHNTEWLNLKISDNGKGISKDDMNKAQSFGLFGMRQRIEGLGGTIIISGKEGRGTNINVKIPV